MQLKHLSAILACAVLAMTPLAAQVAGSPAGDPVKGAHDFHELGCYECHGSVGHGGAWQGPKLAPDPIAFDAFMAQLREPADKMPRYSKVVLSDRDAADVYAYLKSIRHGKTASQIGILNR